MNSSSEKWIEPGDEKFEDLNEESFNEAAHSLEIAPKGPVTDIDIELDEISCSIDDARADNTVQEENTAAQSTALAILSPLKSRSERTGAQPASRRQLKLPLKRLKAAQIITPDLPKSQLSEQFRAIKRPLLRNIDSSSERGFNKSNVIMVTSCVAAEGKTFSAVNLAISLSMEKDIKVLLVDGDVAKASTSSLLGVPRRSLGLIDVLRSNTLTIGEVIWRTDVENLSILPCGLYHEHATELLASEKLRLVLDDVSTRHPDSVVIVDGPPLLLTNEAQVLAQQVGQIVFVVAAEETSHNMLNNALERISGDARISLILNKTTKSTWNSYGYGSYD